MMGTSFELVYKKSINYVVTKDQKFASLSGQKLSMQVQHVKAAQYPTNCSTPFLGPLLNLLSI